MLLTQVCIVEHCPIELYVFTHRGLKNPDRPSERTDFIATIGERNSDRGIPGGNCFGNACDVRDRPGYACSAIALALAGIAIIARGRGIGHIGRHIYTAFDIPAAGIGGFEFFRESRMKARVRHSIYRQRHGGRGHQCKDRI